VNGEPVSLRHVHGNEFHIAFHEVRNEGHVAGQPVKARNDEDCAAPATISKGGKQLWAILMPLPALYLDILRNDVPAAIYIAPDGFTLGIHTESGDALLVSAHPEIANERNVNQRFSESLGV
jgi:hypothetical protein